MLALYSQALNNLNPLTILNRGYAMALDEKQQVLSSVQQFKSEQTFTLHLHDGEVKAKKV